MTTKNETAIKLADAACAAVDDMCGDCQKPNAGTGEDCEDDCWLRATRDAVTAYRNAPVSQHVDVMVWELDYPHITVMSTKEHPNAFESLEEILEYGGGMVRITSLDKGNKDKEMKELVETCSNQEK